MPGDHYGRITGVSARESRQLRAERDAALAARNKAQADLVICEAEDARLRALLVANGIDPGTGGTPPPPPGVPGLQTLDLGGGTIRLLWSNFTPTQLGRNGVDTTGFGAYDTSMAVPPGLTATQLANGYFDFLSLVPGDTYLFTALYSGGQVTISAMVPATPPPTTTPTLSATYRGSGVYRITWANLTPSQLGRDGTDIYGTGAYNTSANPAQMAQALTDGFLDFIGLHGLTTYTFTALYNPVTSGRSTVYSTTFTAANGTDVNGFERLATFNTAGATSTIVNDKAALTVTADGSDRYSKFILPSETVLADERHEFTFSFDQSTVFSATIIMRLTGSHETGDANCYVISAIPDAHGGGGAGLSSQTLVIAKETPTYAVVGQVGMTLASGVVYNGVCETSGNHVRVWAGTGAWDGTTWLLDVTDGSITGAGKTEFWHGDHGNNTSGTRTITFDSLVSSTPATTSSSSATVTVTVPDAGAEGVGAGTGTFTFGAYNGYGFGGVPHFDAITQNTSNEPMTYLVSDDTSGLSTIFSYLATHPNSRAKLSLNILIGEAGNFGSTAEIDKIGQMCQAILNSGYASRFDLRPGYECNGAYGFEWQPRSHGDNFAGFIDLFRRIVTKARSYYPFPILQNFVPWDANIAEMESCYAGDAWVDQITFDNYSSDGSEAQAFARLINSGIPFARSHNKPWGLDEWANRAVADGGHGDDPTFINDQMNNARASADCVSVTWYDSGAGGVDESFDTEPLSLAAMVAQLNAVFP